MTHFICMTCGVQFAALEEPPRVCPICQDERQYVGWKGQRWTTLEALQKDYQNVVKPVEPGLTGIGTTPSFGIGQRALLVQSKQGNVLWDCISLIDQATIEAVEALGGISAIAISHPHLCAAMVEWSHAFDAPIYLHADDQAHVMRPDPAITFWQGETFPLNDEVTLIRCGGHFAGSSVLHWAGGAEGQGALLTGDTIMVVQDRRYVSFMYSYPNLLPLSASAVRRIASAVEPFAFERLYGGWWDKIVDSGAKTAVATSAERYIQLITKS
ncbi:MAG: MBL fold metallo-hydrolase [Anaerolinea sp.]|nr:MBL fold metallo-hydrolase [Anaerolinea sp.]